MIHRGEARSAKVQRVAGGVACALLAFGLGMLSLGVMGLDNPTLSAFEIAVGIGCLLLWCAGHLPKRQKIHSLGRAIFALAGVLLLVSASRWWLP